MKMPKKGEKGFTLIELLIVVAILGVLAAVVIPNVGRFIGRGETEAASTELANIQSAVISMMTDQGIALLATGDWEGTSTNQMSTFPDRDASGNQTNQIVLFGFGGNATINYVVTENTTKFYTINAQGTVTQYDSAGQ